MKRLVVVGNWKMHPDTPAQAAELFSGVAHTARTVRGVDVVVCPPAVWLSACKAAYRGKAVQVGAQDVSRYTSGAHTGDVSAPMLRALGASHVIVGHSERRGEGETDEAVAEKVAAAAGSGLRVILCVGESARDDHGEYLHFLRRELTVGLGNLLPTALHQLILAYEPLWAIGKSAEDAMAPRDMHETSLYLRKLLAEKYGLEAARLVPILYGGSVEPENADALLAEGEVDGFLVGHASLDAVAFGAILKIAHAHAKARAASYEHS